MGNMLNYIFSQSSSKRCLPALTKYLNISLIAVFQCCLFRRHGTCNCECYKSETHGLK